MESEIAPYAAPENPVGFNLTHINCKAAHLLFNQVKVIRSFGHHQLLEELNRGFSLDSSEYEWRRSAIFQLAKLAFTASKVSETLIGAMEKYNYPQGRDYRHFFDNMLYIQEDELPLCDFNANAPANRERYIVCHQMINYFCLLKTSKTFEECSWKYLNSNDNSLPLQSIGAFLIYAEGLSGQVSSTLAGSWSLRREWEEELKESYCQRKSTSETVWQGSLCKKDNENLPEPNQQNFGHWKDHILPIIGKNGYAYSSTVHSEIRTELLKLSDAKVLFEIKARSTNPFFVERFKELEESLRSSKEREETIKKILNYRQKLDELIQKYLGMQTVENWDELQDHVEIFEILIKTKPLGQEYTHIEALLLNAKQLRKPSTDLGKDEF